MTAGAPTLEERVAALEAFAWPPGLVSPSGPLTEEAVAKLRDDLAAVPRTPLRVLPPRPLLTPELARELAREYVTIAEPGEVLLVRVPDHWTVQMVHETQVRLNMFIADRGLPVTVLLLPGEEFAVAKGQPA